MCIWGESKRKIISRKDAKRLSGQAGETKKDSESVIKWVVICICRKWWKSEFVFLLKGRITPASHHTTSFPFRFFLSFPSETFVAEEEEIVVGKKDVKRKMESSEIAIFEIHMANKFYGKLYCGRSCSCGERRKLIFSFSSAVSGREERERNLCRL